MTLNTSVRFASNVRIDTQSPSIVSVHTGKYSGNYSAGTMINVVVEFSKNVTISELPNLYSDTYTRANRSQRIPFAIPYLELNTNAKIPLRGYLSSLSRRKLVFLYHVGVGEETPPGEQLDVRQGTGIFLNGGAIHAEGTGLDVDMSTMPQPGAEGPSAHRIPSRPSKRIPCESAILICTFALRAPTFSQRYPNRCKFEPLQPCISFK
jgi:hypothetical protein